MNLIYHRSVQTDVSVVLAYYDEVGGPSLGAAFFKELMACVQRAKESPTQFHKSSGSLRRANLEHFPYHFLFRLKGDTVRILVVRHNRRHPGFGIRRK